MAKKRFLSKQPHLEGLRAIPGRRALRQRRTRAGLVLLMLLMVMPEQLVRLVFVLQQVVRVRVT